ncbi:hypothetical protein [Reichenbachiella sp. MSK19-1]|uniref:hypothetical protein n=1 Tax=Reichenbachiella sp. MSK19-1 TaxID=1897631 RepID=UPI000E6C6694|nr:hypothetical protein [Reichenbachiella sp. MSK19-1]RJE70662.1 hypothetical protein BGP76_11320 [Reichenbachiella sp. MSK19-1]
MKNFIYIILVTIVAGNLVSCVDSTAPEDEFGSGASAVNFAGFTQSSQALSAVVYDDERSYDSNIAFEVKGPSMESTTGDVAVSIAIDESSTAVEGTHFTLDEKSIVLSEDGDYRGLLPITVLTAGIEPPNTFDLILKISSVDGKGVVANGKTIAVKMVYQCYSDLSGTYLVQNDANCGTAVLTTIVKNDDGSWHIGIGDGGFLGHGCTGNPGLDNWSNIVELCGEILPSDDLEYADCCTIGNIQGGTWDADNGILTMEHTQAFTGNWAGAWVSTYTRQ